MTKSQNIFGTNKYITSNKIWRFRQILLASLEYNFKEAEKKFKIFSWNFLLADFAQFYFSSILTKIVYKSTEVFSGW